VSTIHSAHKVTRSPQRAERRPGSGAPLAAALFALAGVLFVLYPVLRPYSSEAGLAGARAFGSDRWVLAHLCGMVAFGCLAAAICSLTAQRLPRVSALLGVGLILPYYGAETFGLHALGRAALDRGEGSLTSVADTVRDNPLALTMFGAGWIVLALAGVAVTRALWLRDVRTGAALVGAGMVLYLPQFFGPPWLRIAHGVVLGVGLVIVAVRLNRKAAVG
jgi:hypothetical protein